jgi:hypothetical protein
MKKEMKRVFITVILGLALSGCGSVSDDEDLASDDGTDPSSTSSSSKSQEIDFTLASDSSNSVVIRSGETELLSCNLTQSSLHVHLDPFGEDLETTAELQGGISVECFFGQIPGKGTVNIVCDDSTLAPCERVLFQVGAQENTGLLLGESVQVEVALGSLISFVVPTPVAGIYDFESDQLGLKGEAELDCDQTNSEAVRFIEDELGLPCPSGTSVSIAADIALTANPRITTP